MKPAVQVGIMTPGVGGDRLVTLIVTNHSEGEPGPIVIQMTAMVARDLGMLILMAADDVVARPSGGAR